MKPRELKKHAILGAPTSHESTCEEHVPEPVDLDFPEIQHIEITDSVPEEWLENARESLVPLEAEYRRTKSRLLWDHPLDLEVDDQTHRVQALNISTSGLGLINRFSLPDFKQVRIRRTEDSTWYAFTVVHSSQTVGGWKIGLVAGAVEAPPEEASSVDSDSEEETDGSEND